MINSNENCKKKIQNKINFLQAKYTMSNFFHLGLLFVVKYDLNTFLPGFVRFTLARTGRLPCNQISLFYSPCEFPDTHTHTYLYSPSVCECEQQENAVSPVVMLMRVYECVCGFCRETESAVLCVNWPGCSSSADVV